MKCNLVLVGSTFCKPLGNLNLEKFWMPVMNTNFHLSYMISMQLRLKTKMEKLLDMFLNMCQRTCIFLLNTVEEWKWMWMPNGNIQKTSSKWSYKYPACFQYRRSTKKCYTELKNMLKMSGQRNENRIRKSFVVYDPLN